jgi:hypothetical protein
MEDNQFTEVHHCIQFFEVSKQFLCYNLFNNFLMILPQIGRDKIKKITKCIITLAV